MISINHVLREALYNPYGTTELNNIYSHHCENSFKHMKYIAEHREIFCSRNYSDLVNEIEIFYKGILEEYYNLHPEEPMSSVLKETHRLEILAEEIHNKICPLVKNQTNLEFFLDKLANISNGYTRARYKEFYEHCDYLQLWDIYQRQRELLYTSIDKLIKEKEENKENEL